jgi:hypothetical protein
LAHWENCHCHCFTQAKIDEGADEVKGLEGDLPFENGLVSVDDFLTFMGDKAGWVAVLKAERAAAEARRPAEEIRPQMSIPIVLGKLGHALGHKSHGSQDAEAGFASRGTAFG